MSKSRTDLSLVLLFLLFQTTSCFLFPMKIGYFSYLTPSKYERKDYSIGSDNSVSYYFEGSRIDVRYMTDQEMNQLFPDDSQGGKISTNPYTYGDWADPSVGYTPNRFTVFKVMVYNYTFAKVELDPSKAILLTDNGELIQSYVLLPTEGRQSLEGYYRAVRGISGNEFYRFAKRLGILRSTLYDEEEKIFKGENYSGFIIFETLYPDVKRCRLILKNFILKFDASDKPLETVDISFDFDRGTEKKIFVEQKEKEEVEKTKVVVTGPSQITGNRVGDVTRDAGAINSVVDANLPDINKCFQDEFERGKALEGKIVVQFTILVNGMIQDAKVTESTVTSSVVENCLINKIKGWRFRPAGTFASRTTPGTPTRESQGVTGQPQSDIQGTPSTQSGQTIQQPQMTEQRVPVSDVVVVYPFQFVSTGRGQ